jgi:putative ABC transport system permease protein
MSVFRQIGAVVGMNLRSIPRRLGASCVVVIGIAGVVGVVISIFGMNRSLGQALVDSGRPNRAVVLRNGSDGEGSSTLLVDAVGTIKNAPGIARTPDGDAAASAEMITTANFKRTKDGSAAGLPIRGYEPQAFFVRPEIKIVAGRVFKPGLREVIVGRGVQKEFQDLEIGDKVPLRNSQWEVVGVFESGGDVNESRVIADEATLLSAYGRTAASSVTVLLTSEAAFDEFKEALTTNPTLSVSVERENEYYLRQSKNATTFFGFVATFVGGVMALGALFAALNTMYSAVSTRAVEIATLRAIGFGATGVVISVLVESLALALLGAVIGAAVAWGLFSGNTISLGNTTASLVFQMQVTPALLAVGIGWACAVGFIGGLLPAVRAARLPVATALRAV